MKLCYNFSFFFIIIVSYYSAITSGESSESRPEEKYKVVIIGAGIAGLGAATRLLQNNVTDILVLEASNRLGGRVNTAIFGDYLIEYGAQWIHGQDGNAVYEMVEPYNVTLLEYFDSVDFVKNRDSKVNLSLADEIYSEAYFIFDNTEDLAFCNCSLEHYFETRYNDIVKSMDDVDNYTVEAIKDISIKFQGSGDGVRDLSKEGSWGNVQYSQLNGSETVAWRSGYQTFIDILVGKQGDSASSSIPVTDKIQFNKVVQKVNWTENGVELTCEDGSHYLAAHVIVTVSLGVLKESAHDLFIPPLPERKMSAIQSLGFGVVNKIFIQFATRWWPMQFEYMLTFLWSKEDVERFKKISKHGGWATEIICFHSVVNEPRVLEGWIVGDAARNLELLSDKEVTDAVMEVLHWFKDDKLNISTPINITRSAWFSNKFVRGSYSFRTLHSDHNGYFAADIAQPVTINNTPMVLFAGEATHDHYFSTVHGALETGWREATRVLNYLGTLLKP